MTAGRICLITLSLCLCLPLTGCRDQRIIERLGFTRTIAMDLAPVDEESEEKPSKEMLKITLSIPKASPENSRIVLTATSHSSKEARLIASRKNNRRIVSGQLRTSLFDNRLARTGLWKYIDTLVRDPSIGSKVNVVVVSGDANALLQRDYPQYPSTGLYIDDLLKSETGVTEIPPSTLLAFTRDYFEKGIDPVAPLLKEDKEAITIDGIALFKDDRYVGRIPPNKSLLFSFLRSSINNGEMVMRLAGDQDEGEETVMLSFVTSKQKVKAHVRTPVTSGKDITFDIHLKISGEVLEYTGKLDLQQVADQKKLEKQMSDYIVKETSALIEQMKRLHTDPIGLGLRVRNHMAYSAWRKIDWNEKLLSDVTVNVHADIKIKDIGKLQESDQEELSGGEAS